MTKCKKSDLKKIFDSLPENTSIEGVMEKLYFFVKVEKGLYDVDNGNTLSHSEVKEKMKKWIE